MILELGVERDLVEVVAGELMLDPLLIASFIMVESSGNPWAWNPEPPYRFLWDVKHAKPFRPLTVAERVSEVPPKDFPGWKGADPDAEWWGQQCSWGLMQVMGGVARERGFKGTFLTQLSDPEINLWTGSRHLAALARRYTGDDLYAAYNAGSPRRVASGAYENQGYVDKIREQLGRLKDGRDELEG